MSQPLITFKIIFIEQSKIFQSNIYTEESIYTIVCIARLTQIKSELVCCHLLHNGPRLSFRNSLLSSPGSQKNKDNLQ